MAVKTGTEIVLIKITAESCLKNHFFMLLKVVWQQFVGEVGKFVTFWYQFLHDIAYQSVEFSQSYL